jgi:hypothetical protein
MHARRFLGYDMVTLTRKYTHVQPGESGAFWQSGTAPSVLHGDFFLSMANGPFNPAPAGDDYGDSIIRLSTNASEWLLSPSLPTNLNVADFFTPSNQAYLSAQDLDFGSSGALLIDGAAYVVGIGKIGTLFLLNATNLGGYVPPTATQGTGSAPYSPNALQVRPCTTFLGHADKLACK